jgi:hypothetical protein
MSATLLLQESITDGENGLAISRRTKGAVPSFSVARYQQQHKCHLPRANADESWTQVGDRQSGVAAVKPQPFHRRTWECVLFVGCQLDSVFFGLDQCVEPRRVNAFACKLRAMAFLRASVQVPLVYTTSRISWSKKHRMTIMAWSFPWICWLAGAITISVYGGLKLLEGLSSQQVFPITTFLLFFYVQMS